MTNEIDAAEALLCGTSVEIYIFLVRERLQCKNGNDTRNTEQSGHREH